MARYRYFLSSCYRRSIDDWAGILVSDGYGVYRHWVQARQTCLAHLIRTARGLAARDHPDLAACGTWAMAELQRLCHMATAPPTGGEWRAWYARLCKLIDQYHDRQDDAGKFARRLLREMDCLWVFLAQHGVEPTNNRAEVRFVDQKPTLHKVWGIGPEFKSAKALGLENLIPVSV